MPRIALCQMAVGADKAANIARAVAMIRGAAGIGLLPCPAAGQRRDDGNNRADLVVLPECFNCPYGTKYFGAYAELIPALGSTGASSDESPTVAAIASAAAEANVWVVAGSIPERDVKGRLYNSSMTFGPDGVLRGLHRKMHLFKINTETVKFDEAEVLTAGNSPTVVDATGDLGAALGVAICFDIRYPQLASYYASRGTGMIVYPGAFNMVTGPKHWHLCARSRAVDNQQFVALCSPARDEKADYVAYGHSLVVDPWGETVASTDGGDECVVFADVNWDAVASARQRLPILDGVRNDLYSTVWSVPPENSSS
jgi:predicted amidohydrolase